MNKVETAAVGFVQSLCKDALGNGITGNTERSLRYTADALRVLTAMDALTAAKGNSLAEMAAERALRELLSSVGDKPTWPKFEMNAEVFAQYSGQSWAVSGITADS